MISIAASPRPNANRPLPRLPSYNSMPEALPDDGENAMKPPGKTALAAASGLIVAAVCLGTLFTASGCAAYKLYSGVKTAKKAGEYVEDKLSKDDSHHTTTAPSKH